MSSACDTRLKESTLTKFGNGMTKKNVPLSSRKAERTCIEKPLNSGRTDWKIDVAVPKNCSSAAENPNEESECSSVTKRCERINSDARSISSTRYEYVDVDDKQELSSVSDLFTESIKTKVVTTHCDAFDDASLVKSTGTSRRFPADEVSIGEQRYSAKLHDRRSLDSTITEATSQTMHGCCSQTEKEIALIRKHLLEIENKQSNLMDMLKVTHFFWVLLFCSFLFLTTIIHVTLHHIKLFRFIKWTCKTTITRVALAFSFMHVIILIKIYKHLH